ncbi:Aldo/keto reductase [Backusella circina FSU 941]|nr:Aldo/keto reductase [Backusella circina FSU 941]
MSASNTPKMQYVRFGNTGLRVSRFSLGCMSYGSSKWQAWVKDEEESIALIGKAYDAGINFFDTANVYSNGESERILGKAIKKFGFPRSRIVVASKVFFPVSEEGTNNMGLSVENDPAFVNGYGLSRKHIFDAVDASLKRLDLDYIDLYQIHRFDPNTPIEETMEALHDLVRSGKVRYIGASSMLAWQFQKANSIAEKRGWTKFSSMQNLYNLIYREEEREMIPYCESEGIAIIPWSPLARGLLTGKKHKSVRTDSDRNIKKYFGGEQQERNDEEIVDRVCKVAEKHGVSPAKIALAWVLTKPFITAPIVGIGKEEHLHDIIGSLDVQLSEEEKSFLEEAYICRNLIAM